MEKNSVFIKLSIQNKTKNVEQFIGSNKNKLKWI